MPGVGRSDPGQPGSEGIPGSESKRAQFNPFGSLVNRHIGRRDSQKVLVGGVNSIPVSVANSKHTVPAGTKPRKVVASVCAGLSDVCGLGSSWIGLVRGFQVVDPDIGLNAPRPDLFHPALQPAPVELPACRKRKAVRGRHPVARLVRAFRSQRHHVGTLSPKPAGQPDFQMVPSQTQFRCSGRSRRNEYRSLHRPSVHPFAEADLDSRIQRDMGRVRGRLGPDHRGWRPVRRAPWRRHLLRAGHKQNQRGCGRAEFHTLSHLSPTSLLRGPTGLAMVRSPRLRLWGAPAGRPA